MALPAPDASQRTTYICYSWEFLHFPRIFCVKFPTFKTNGCRVVGLYPYWLLNDLMRLVTKDVQWIYAGSLLITSTKGLLLVVFFFIMSVAVMMVLCHKKFVFTCECIASTGVRSVRLNNKTLAWEEQAWRGNLWVPCCYLCVFSTKDYGGLGWWWCFYFFLPLVLAFDCALPCPRVLWLPSCASCTSLKLPCSYVWENHPRRN